MIPESCQELVGKKCWHVSAGGVTSPSFVLVLGEKVPRPVPLKNQAQPVDFRENRGSVELLVWCSWRLNSQAEVVASSSQDPCFDLKLRELVGSRVESVDCVPPFWDLSVRFSNSIELQVFSNNVISEESALENWELWLPLGVTSVGPGSRVSFEPSASETGP